MRTLTGAAGVAMNARRIASLVITLCVACAALLVGQGSAHAANRDWLRPDNTGTCDWDAVGYWVQRCDVWSPSMSKNIQVMIKPASNGGNAGFYLLDGMRATDVTNAIANQTSILPLYVDTNLTLVMPVGGAGSFYADWNGDNATFGSSTTVNYKWETFLTSELPAYLAQNFGVSQSNNSVAGLSMGATAALNLAAKHPNQFRQALSWSGYLHTTAPGFNFALRIAMLDVGGFNLTAMYGSLVNPLRYENDPYENLEGLRNTDVYISAASGAWGPVEMAVPLQDRLYGSILEIFSRMQTREWETKAREAGLSVTTNYEAIGIHDWSQWDWQVNITRDRVLNVMNAW